MTDEHRFELTPPLTEEQERQFFPGNPARHVLGRPEEQSAPRHAPLPPRPWSTRRLLSELREHLDALDAEAKRIRAAVKALEGER